MGNTDFMLLETKCMVDNNLDVPDFFSSDWILWTEKKFEMCTLMWLFIVKMCTSRGLRKGYDGSEMMLRAGRRKTVMKYQMMG
jgi:hypothetical protein